MVFPFQAFQLLGIVLLEEGQVDVDGHGKIPKCIGRDEPVYVS